MTEIMIDMEEMTETGITGETEETIDAGTIITTMKGDITLIKEDTIIPLMRLIIILITGNGLIEYLTTFAFMIYIFV